MESETIALFPVFMYYLKHKVPCKLLRTEEIVRSKMIGAYLERLSASLDGISPQVGHKELRALFDRKDIVGMVQHIRVTLRLDLKVRIGFVNKGGPTNTPAWIVPPKSMPPFGTRAFRETQVTMYIRKSFLSQAPFETVVLVLAHELCHVVLQAIDHKLKYEEVAVDLTAMILGYRNFFRIGCQHTEVTQPIAQEPLLWRMINRLRGSSSVTVHTYILGYLTLDEINFAADIMDRQAKRAQR